MSETPLSRVSQTRRALGWSPLILLVALGAAAIVYRQVVNWSLLLEYWKVVGGVLQAAAAPSAVVLVAYLFKAPFAALIHRLEQVEGMGFKGHFQSESQERVSAEPAPTPPEPRKDQLPSNAVQATDTAGTTESAATAQRSDEELVKLHQALSTTQWELWFERMYRVIYGSQLRVLLHLNRQGVSGTSAADVATIYQQHVSLADDAAKSDFNRWIGFLTRNNFVMFDTFTNTYHITATGVSFLQYLVNQFIPPFRPY